MSLVTHTYARSGAAETADGLVYPPPEEGQAVWVEVRAASDEEIGQLRQAFGLHELAVEDVIHARQRPKLDRYEDHVFAAAYTAAFVHGRVTLEELGLFTGRDYLITFGHGAPEQLQKLRQRLEQAPGELRTSPAFLLYATLDQVVDEYFEVADRLADAIGEIEETILSDGSEAEVQRRVFTLRRDVLFFRRVVAPLREVIGTLTRKDAPVAEPSLQEHFRDLYDHVVRVYEDLDTYHDLLGAALEAHLTVVNNRLNEVVLKVSAWAAIIGVPTFIASVYGMNYGLWPFRLGSHTGFWYAVALMGGGGAALYSLFKRRGWL